MQLEKASEKGVPLEGAGIIIPKIHRETIFDVTQEEWVATYDLLQAVKQHLDKLYEPDGYNLGWNCGEVAGQHIPHAHFHVLPRYEDELLAGKGIRYLFKGEQNKRTFRNTHNL
ncbi:HIT family protein [Planomicrobium sp. YIM 101495]|uniref:HIT family protein n=1 Tax=Planomicrobium sp. YIM 101495 TaxID=2665160 RepID=UPI00351A96B6